MTTINTTHNLKIVYITDFAPGTPPANNIFMAYQMAQGSVPGSAILINKIEFKSYAIALIAAFKRLL